MHNTLSCNNTKLQNVRFCQGYALISARFGAQWDHSVHRLDKGINFWVRAQATV